MNSRASVSIINKHIACPEGKSLIIPDDSFAGFIKAIRHHRSFVASHASVSPNAEIGERTVIQPDVFADSITGQHGGDKRCRVINVNR